MKSIPLVIGLALASMSTEAAECGMKHSFFQKDDEGRTSVSVWSDEGDALLFGEDLHVNTDGSSRSYSVDDFWGEQYALNNLCNAMSDKCADLTNSQKRDRRILTQNAMARGWPAELLAKTRIDHDIVLFDGNKPCPQVDGYIPSATALRNLGTYDSCDPKQYIDSLIVPAVVLPKGDSGFRLGGANVGDLAFVTTEELVTFTAAVVGDLGPRTELGEGTLALSKILLGKQNDPVSYVEVRGRGNFVGQGWDVPNGIVLIFPSTRNDDEPFVTVDRIDAAGAAAFDKWGGMERLQACVEAYTD
jgi:hypothetical protein